MISVRGQSKDVCNLACFSNCYCNMLEAHVMMCVIWLAGLTVTLISVRGPSEDVYVLLSCC